MRIWRLVVAVALVCGAAQSRSVLLISVDGMRPDYVTRAAEHGLKVPNLKRIVAEGAYAEGVRGVIPTVTYPSHTTIVTGVLPATHGISANVVFDPELKNLQGWYWYAEAIKVPTLWDAAHEAGIKTASVSWPVTVGAKIDYLIPEVWRAGDAEDGRLLRALSTPGLLAPLEAKLGRYPNAVDSSVPNDRLRARFAEEILGNYKPNLTMVHLAALDHAEHGTGPFSSESNSVMEAEDAIVQELTDAAKQTDPQATVCVVSDHGFLPVTHRLNLARAFLDAGLFRMSPQKSRLGLPTVEDWTAMPWVNGGSAAVVLRDRQDGAGLEKTDALLRRLSADPANGIARIVGREELKRKGAFPTADFVIDMRSGFGLEFSIDGPLSRDVNRGGDHGYLPEHEELNASFFIIGPGIPAGRNLGTIDMTDVGPTLAKILGVHLKTARGKAVLP